MKIIYLRHIPSNFYIPVPISNWSDDANGDSSLHPLCNGFGKGVKILRCKRKLSMKSQLGKRLYYNTDVLTDEIVGGFWVRPLIPPTV